MRGVIGLAMSEGFLLSNDGIFAKTDFEFVPVRILKEESVVSRAVFGTDFRSFQILATDLAHECGDTIDFLTIIGSK